MEPWQLVFLGWLAFGLTHSGLLLTTVKSFITERIGRIGFLLVFSAVAFSTFVPTVWIYVGHRHTGSMIWFVRDNPGMVAAAMLFCSFGFVLALAGILKPSPLGIQPGGKPSIRGLMSITRHPMLAGLALWGAGHLLLNGFLSDIVFFSGFLLYCVCSAAHQDHRVLAEQPELKDFIQRTSFVPFAAIIGGQCKLVISELPWLAITVAGGASVFAYWLHP